MSKVSVVYWSQSGNTQAMAEAVAASQKQEKRQRLFMFQT